ncbi:MAG: iron-sulfur cluster assembly scaffold protein [Erythrobacter sp.]
MSDPGAAPSTKLYTPRLLGLSASLAAFPLDDRFSYAAEAHSRTCGSTIKLGLDLDGCGLVERIGMQVTACAVGQSSAAVLAQGIEGVDQAGLDQQISAIAAWLSNEADLPDFPQFDALASAQEHKGRHEALLLPWKATKEALSLGATSR